MSEQMADDPEVFQPSGNEVAEVADPLEYVGFKRRLGARLIDLLLHYTGGFGVGLFLAIAAALREGATGHPAAAVMQALDRPTYGIFLPIFGSLAYHAIMEGLHGSTIGKRMLGIVVLRDDARPCGIWAAFVRSSAILFDGLLFGLVAEYSMKSNKRERRYGDIWAHTVVVTRRSSPPASLRSFWRLATVGVVAIMSDGLVTAAEAIVALFSTT
ncbi:MAG: RDD family protein [Acidobacteriota bacterium]